MNPRRLPLILIIAFSLVAVLMARWQLNRKIEYHDKVAEIRKKGFNRNVTLEYTAHAKCRMECRDITEDEVVQVLKAGLINNRRTDLEDKPCPTFALEGFTTDNQRVRIVFAQCETKTKVVTCIDLESNQKCVCSGREKKYQNRN